MALKVKSVDPSVVGQSGSPEFYRRPAFAVYDGSKLVYKTKRGGGRGTPMFGFTEETAERLLVKERTRRAGGGTAAKPKAPRAAAKASRPARKKLSRQTLTVDSCQSFLEDRGYKVKKSKKKKSASPRDPRAFLQPGFMGNPRRRRKNPLEEWVYVFIHPLGEMQDVVMASSEADARKKAKAELEKMRRDGEHVSADNLLYVEQAAWHPEDGDYDYSLEAYGRNNPRKNRDASSSRHYAGALAEAHMLMMEESNKTDNYADFVGIGYRRMSENPRMYLAHAVAESNAILNSRASASTKKAARRVIKAITDQHPELAQFESRSRSGIRKFNPKAVKGRSSWQQYLRLMKGKGYSMGELRAGYRQLKKKYPNNTKQLLAAARKLPSMKEIVKRKNPRRRRTRRKNPAQSVYVVTFRIGGGRDKYEDTIMASSQAEAIRLAEDMMDEMGDGVLVSVVPQAVADAEIIFDFKNPRPRKSRRKNPRAMRRLR